jgi:hypothetical protein
MGYLHINNLYKDQTVLMFKEVYALEKIHGTSAHVSCDPMAVGFFSGGESYERFKGLFNAEDLLTRYKAVFQGDAPTGPKVIFYGEAYGGKQQGMSGTYGKELKFIVFDVKVGDTWLAVPDAHDVAVKLGLEFVAYEKVPATVEALDAERDRPSRQAVRNGVLEPRPAEGVVIRPLIELIQSNGSRIIAKHKGAEFSERASKRDTTVDPTKAVALATAEAVAKEWVVPMRLDHVLDKLRAKLQRELGLPDTGTVIEAMVEDVLREGAGEFEDTKDVRRAVGGAASKMFRQRLAAVT